MSDENAAGPRTLPADGAAQLARLVGLLREVLGESVLGAYLFGSAVFGGLHPMSDLDVLAVVDRPLTADERGALIAQLLRISGRGDASGASRSIELTVVVQSDVRPWRYPPRMELQYGDWWRAEFERGDLAPWNSPNPDLALLLDMALRADRPLLGPPPARLLDPVPPGDVRRAMLDEIPSLLSYLDGDEANVVLTFARIWATLATGTILSKDAAAGWVLARLPVEHRAVLAHANAIYLGSEPDDWDALRPRLRAHVDRVILGIEGAAANAPN